MIKGTRVPVSVILDTLAAGLTDELGNSRVTDRPHQRNQDGDRMAAERIDFADFAREVSAVFERLRQSKDAVLVVRGHEVYRLEPARDSAAS